jgi:hypothetical protein
MSFFLPIIALLPRLRDAFPLLGIKVLLVVWEVGRLLSLLRDHFAMKSYKNAYPNVRGGLVSSQPPA